MDITYTTKSDGPQIMACFTDGGVSYEVPIADVAENEIQATLQQAIDDHAEFVALFNND